MQLKTRRLILREFRMSDLRAVHHYAGDSDTTKYMDWGPNNARGTRDFIKLATYQARQKPRLAYNFAITLKGEVIGSAGLVIGSRLHRNASFGYILKKEAWGNGYATEAARALVTYGFTKLKLQRIWATCRPENKRSANVLKKLGLKYEGRLRKDKLVRGKFRDSLLFAKTR